MLDPENGRALESTDTLVSFNGHLLAGTSPVVLQASPTPGGPFSPWPGSSTTSSPSPSLFGVPTGTGTTLSIYPWSVTSTIPAAQWGVELHPSGCDVAATYVRAESGTYDLSTFDVASDTYPGGFECLLDAILIGQGISSALTTCASDDSPVVRLHAPLTATHVGNVTITSQAEADALSCVPTIDGNLTIAPSAPTTIELPALTSVTGDVALSLPVEAPPAGPYVEARCGSNNPSIVQSVITRVHLPSLTTVGGSVDIDAPSTGVPTTAGEPIELGLPALSDLGGSLSISLATPATSPCGLEGLTTLAGDLTITLSSGDVGAAMLLPSLQDVDGTVTVSGGFSVLGLLGALNSAGAIELSAIVNLAPFGSLAALLDVSGIVRLHDLSGNPVLTSLQSAGTVELDGTAISSLAAVGSSSMLAGGLSLYANPSLSQLGSAGSSNVDLSPGAPLIVGTAGQDNVALTGAEVCEFVAYQQGSNGWTPTGSGFACP